MCANSKFWPLASNSWDSEELEVLSSSHTLEQHTMGPSVKKFESEFAQYFGASYAVFCNSGSSANLLMTSAIMEYHGITKGEILAPAVSWSTSYFPFLQLGFDVKLVDIDLDTLNSPASHFSDSVSDETVGILAVNLLGNPAQLQEIENVAEEKRLFFLEDNCESMGASVSGRFAGTFGAIGSFSTYFSHHISTIEGGMCVTNNPDLYEIMLAKRAHGWTRNLASENYYGPKGDNEFYESFRFVTDGYNLRPTEIHAKLGSAQLEKLDAFVSQRRLNAESWVGEMGEIPWIKIQMESGRSSWFGFSIILTNDSPISRNDLVNLLIAEGIECRPIVAGNFANQPVASNLGGRLRTSGDLPNAQVLHHNGLFVGNSHTPLKSQISHLASKLRELTSLD